MLAATGTAWSAALVLLAGTFAVVSGVNDGGALLSPGLKIPSLSTLFSFCLLVSATAAGPLLFGTRVAATFLGRLVPSGSGTSGRAVLVVGVAVALAVVLLLSLRGLPTSLTLAVVGGLTGAGFGWGRPVPAGSVVAVLAAAALAPIISSLIAGVATRSLRLAGTRRSPAAVAVGRTHRVAFPLQCLAYGANDGQKMIALFAVAAGGAAGAGAGSVRFGAGALTGCAVLFGLGALLGLPRAAVALGSGI
ncbi:MAG: hypothetical protein HOW97_33870, partial [Catenulispora sp.]|nr:hypothetical protein [Catenulispora sp.]